MAGGKTSRFKYSAAAACRQVGKTGKGDICEIKKEEIWKTISRKKLTMRF